MGETEAMHTSDKDFLLHELKESGADFESAIASIPPKHWLKRPSEQQWSAADCAEHVLIVEQRLQRLVAKMEHSPEEGFDLEHSLRKDQMTLDAAKREGRFQAPEIVQPKGAFTDAGKLLTSFRETRANTIEVAARYPEWLRGRFAEHPILKKLDGHQWLLMIASHSRRHAAQIREILEELSATAI